MDPAGAVVSLLLDVVILGHGRDQGSASGELAHAFQNDLRPAVIHLDRAANFNDASGEAADVANVFQVGAENDHVERAAHLIFAEVNVVDSSGARLHPQNFSHDAFVLADVFAGFADGQAVRSCQRCGNEEHQDGENYSLPEPRVGDLIPDAWTPPPSPTPCAVL